MAVFHAEEAFHQAQRKEKRIKWINPFHEGPEIAAPPVSEIHYSIAIIYGELAKRQGLATGCQTMRSKKRIYRL
jgi:hypothetical protein